MRILHVIPSVAVGGAQIMLLRLLEHWRIPEDRHGVVSLMPFGILRAPMAASGATLTSLDLPQGRMSPRAGVELARIVRRFRPDVLQGWMYHGNLAATVGRALSRARCPVLWGVHHSITGLTREKRSTRGVIRLSARLSRGTARVIFCSETSAAQHEQIGFETSRTVVIPNGFDCDAFRPRAGAGATLRRMLGVDAATIVIGMVARYHPMKDHSNLLAAVAGLPSEPPVHLVLAGHEVDRNNAALTRAIGDAGLNERVTLLGESQNMPEIMAGFDMLVVPSAWGEAFPLVLGEAMASGVPCIATDVGDSRLIIGETGLVVAPREPIALADGLWDLVQRGADGRAQLGMAARARIVSEFSAPAIAARYHDVCCQALMGGGHRTVA